jgi:hypothetical protein
MWEPRRLTTIWASTACYRHGFTFLHYIWRRIVMMIKGDFGNLTDLHLSCPSECNKVIFCRSHVWMGVRLACIHTVDSLAVFNSLPIAVAARLKRELSPLAQPLGSWVRIPLKAWMSVRGYSVFVLSCVRSGLSADWSPVQEDLPTFYKIKRLKRNGVSQMPYGGEGATGIK